MTYKSDEELQSEVRFQLGWDSRVKQGEVSVAVHKGVVTLTGAVNSWDEKRAILGAVSHTPGVSALHDHLFIDPYTPRFEAARAS